MICGAFLKNTAQKIIRGKPKIVFLGTINTIGQHKCLFLEDSACTVRVLLLLFFGIFGTPFYVYCLLGNKIMVFPTDTIFGFPLKLLNGVPNLIHYGIEGSILFS